MRALTLARKTLIVTGMLLAMTMVACSYVQSSLAVMLLMSLAFFGKGFGALGWTVISNASPRNLVDINGDLFNLIESLTGITTPIIIGLIVEHAHDEHFGVSGFAGRDVDARYPSRGSRQHAPEP